MPMVPDPQRAGRLVLIAGWGGFCLYLALAAMVFRVVTDPHLLAPPYLMVFDIYFLFAAIFGICLWIDYNKTWVDRKVLFLMAVPGLVVLVSGQLVYLIPLRGFLAISPIIGTVYLIGKVRGSARIATKSESLWNTSWLHHMIVSILLIVIFEYCFGAANLLGGLLIWGNALFLAVLLLGKAVSTFKILHPGDWELTRADGATATEPGRALRLFMAACAVTLILLVLPLNILVMEPHPEIEDASASSPYSDIFHVHLVVVNRYARPIEGTIQVYAIVGNSSHLVGERNGLEGLGAWTIDSGDLMGGSSGNTCHFTVVHRGQTADEGDAEIQPECVVFPVIITTCVLCTGIRKMAVKR